MSQESGSDPWDEVRGLPWRVKEYRTPPGKEQSWETTLDEIGWLVLWLADDVRDLQVSIHLVFDSYLIENKNILAKVGKLDPDAAFEVFDRIREHVEGRIKEQSAVQKLILRLLQKVHREVRDALQASQSGLDE